MLYQCMFSSKSNLCKAAPVCLTDFSPMFDLTKLLMTFRFMLEKVLLLEAEPVAAIVSRNVPVPVLGFTFSLAANKDNN